jgi:hypothetical protein
MYFQNQHRARCLTLVGTALRWDSPVQMKQYEIEIVVRVQALWRLLKTEGNVCSQIQTLVLDNYFHMCVWTSIDSICIL